jgi:hypothetical protein
MKIRSGFVSNSSSSSFVLYGYLLPGKELAEFLGQEWDDGDDWYSLNDSLKDGGYKVGNVRVEPARCFFDRSDHSNDVIIGYKVADLNDGVPEDIDIEDVIKKYRLKIQREYGKLTDEVPKLWVQYISNDNF